jgi:hypothetical protein
MPRSRITTGFHRLGIVPAVPLFVLAMVTAFLEWKSPSGSLDWQPPVGALAYGFGSDELDYASRQMLDEQRATGLNLPTNMMLVGLPGEIASQDGVEWKKFQLWDGREIGIASNDQKKLDTIARIFLLNEKRNQYQYTDKDDITIDSIRVKFLNFFDQFPPASPPWLVKTHNWMLPLISLGLAAMIYIAMWALGWVVSGFSRPTT